ncbi:MAG: saccharopine dehydrogenase C-terminal domain-containing protein [Ignavibacteriaceae bacterium]
MKKILILGAGLVSEPGVKYLLRDSNLYITIAALNVERAEELISDSSNGEAVFLDAENEDQLKTLIGKNDIIVSLLPWTYHPKVARICLDSSKHLVTASYVSEAMKNLDSEVGSKGLLFLNELGLDPGIDHMSAMKIIDRVRNEEGKVLHFYSYCGGLPAPKDNNNPFGYKFSWSPRGVILASRNDARFLEDGEEIYIEGKDLFLNYEIEEVPGLGAFEVYPNRNSLPYKELYRLDDALTIKRGTYRNLGWCDTLKKIVDLGLVDDTPRANLAGKTFRKIIAEILNIPDNPDVRNNTAARLSLLPDSEIINRLDWLGLFSEQIVDNKDNYLDILSEQMQKKLQYAKGEVDMVLLRHKFIIEEKNGEIYQVTSTLVDYGIPDGESSMARTVSLPLAIGVKLIAEGKINLSGVRIPNMPEIYLPVLEELESMGIKISEEKSKI